MMRVGVGRNRSRRRSRAGEVGDPWRAERLAGRSSALQVAYRRVLGSAVMFPAVRSSATGLDLPAVSGADWCGPRLSCTPSQNDC